MSGKPVLSLIVAMARNRVIGINNGLPWRLSGDMAFFKQSTMGKPIIMGRKTFESIGRPLPGRTNIVVTRQPLWQAQGVLTATSLEQAMALAGEHAVQNELNECVLIGGASLYEQGLALCERMYITLVQADVHGDAWFPDYDVSQWRELSRQDCVADDKNQFPFTIVTLERIA